MIKYFSIVFLVSNCLNAGDVVGQGFLKTRGGSVITCAGEAVYLEKWQPETIIEPDVDPVLLYTSKLLVLDSEKCLAALRGFSNITSLNKMKELNKFLNSANKEKMLTAETMCDAQGNFEFYDVSKGKYIAMTKVEWMLTDDDDKKEGGYVKKIFTVQPNKKKMKILITELQN